MAAHALLLLLAISLAAAPPSCVMDQASRDPQFLALRERLIRSLESGLPLSQFATLLSPRIQTSFDPAEDGLPAFEKKLAQPAYRQELLRVLRLGGSFAVIEGRRQFLAPFTNNEKELDDPFSVVFPIARGLSLRARPSPQAPALAVTTCAPLSLPLQSQAPSGWREVLWNAKPAFIEDSQVLSPVGYRASFARGPQGWRLISFVAGD